MLAPKTWVIRNPIAGKNSQQLVIKMLDILNKKMPLTICNTSYAGHARKLTADACREKADLLIVAGGDGTINEIINILTAYKKAHGSCPILAIFPSGTVNLIANELNIPQNPEDFADVILANEQCDIWPGQINDHYFIANIGVGFDGYVVNKVSGESKKKFSKLAYAYQSLMLIRKDWQQSYNINIDGQNYSACAAIVANSMYYAGPYSITPQLSLTDPQLYVCLFESGIRWDIFSYFYWLIRDDLYNHPHVKIIPGQNITINGTAQYVQIDGDPAGTLPLSIACGITPLRIITNNQ